VPVSQQWEPAVGVYCVGFIQIIPIWMQQIVAFMVATSRMRRALLRMEASVLNKWYVRFWPFFHLH
jgi:hypothetical protein